MLRERILMATQVVVIIDRRISFVVIIDRRISVVVIIDRRISFSELSLWLISFVLHCMYHQHFRLRRRDCST